MRVLITGTSKGLGKFLSENITTHQIVKFDRLTPFYRIEEDCYDLVIHCAFNTRNSVSQEELNWYVRDNIILTDDMVNKIKSKRFIFISSIDVYPDDVEYKHEDVDIDINDIPTLYGKMKLMAESIVKTHTNYLILRCGGIIGPNKLPKSIQNILKDGKTSLTSDSIVSYIHQKNIMEIINKESIQNETVNVASDTTMCISELEKIRTPISYGWYKYLATNVITDKFKSLYGEIEILPSKDTLFDVLANK